MMPETESEQTVLHATAVALNRRGLLIRGASGSGKSALALELMALGADLISDDRVIVTRENGLWLDAPDTIRGLIEARGLGILTALPAGPTPLHAVVDLDQTEKTRLPQRRETVILKTSFPLFYRVSAPHFVPSLIQLLRAGRHA